MHVPTKASVKMERAPTRPEAPKFALRNTAMEFALVSSTTPTAMSAIHVALKERTVTVEEYVLAREVIETAGVEVHTIVMGSACSNPSTYTAKHTVEAATNTVLETIDALSALRRKGTAVAVAQRALCATESAGALEIQVSFS